MTSDPLRAYRQTRVKTASQGQLIVMLYDEGLKQLKIAEGELGKEQSKLDVAHNAIIKAQDIITELMVSLDFEKGGISLRISSISTCSSISGWWIRTWRRMLPESGKFTI